MKSWYIGLCKLLYFVILILTLSSCNVGSNIGSANDDLSQSKVTAAIPKIISYSINNINGTIVNNTISVVLPYGTSLTSLIAVFSTNTGTALTVNGVTQYSGITANNFTNPVTYVATNSGSKVSYVVTVTIQANDAKTLSGFAINNESGLYSGNNIAVQLPYGTDLTSLAATFTTTGESVLVNGITQTSGKTLNNFESPVIYVVKAADGSTQPYDVTATVAPSSAKAILSYSINNQAGSFNGNNISLTLPYGTSLESDIATFTTTGASVSVNGIPQISGQTPNHFESQVTYLVKAEDGTTESYTVTVNVAASSYKAITSYAINGIQGTITGTNISVTLPSNTSPNSLKSLIAKFTTNGVSVTVESTSQVSQSTPNDFENPVVYVVNAADGTTQAYTVTVFIAASSAKSINSFAINGYNGTFYGNNISVQLPYGTKLASLPTTFTTTGATVTVNGVIQTSGSSSQNFESPVTYVVTAADGTTESYIVVVTVSAINDAAITSFQIGGNPGSYGYINGESISVVVPYGTRLTSLIANFIATGNVTINGVTQTSGQTSNSFESPVKYIVTAADGSTQAYTVTVTIAPSSSKQLLNYVLNGTPGNFISESTISVLLPSTTTVAALTSLSAAFSTNGVSVTVNGVTQDSNSKNDFRNPVVYVVTAADGSTQVYTVIATVAASSDKAITSFQLSGTNGVINQTNHTITVTFPFGTPITALYNTGIVTTGVSVTVNGVVQTLSTYNNFTNPVIYLVTAADGSTQSYTVQAIVSSSTQKVITSFKLFESQIGIINESNGTISLQVPYGTSVTALNPKFTFIGNSVTVNNVNQTQQSYNDFTNPVTYVVTAADGSTKSYVVTVTIEPNSAKEMLSYSLVGVSGTISDDGIISESLPYNVDLGSLVATFTFSGKSVTVNGVNQLSGTTANNFTNPVTYIVTAADGSTQSYTVIVTVLPNSTKAILSYSLNGYVASITGQSIYVPNFNCSTNNINAAIAKFTTATGDEVYVNDVLQVSESTVNNFSSPVTYYVYAEDGTSIQYFVTVNCIY